MPVTVEGSPEIRAQIAELKEHPNSKAHRQLLKCLERCAKELLPQHAHNPNHMLSGPLRGVVWRVKQGRLRVFYATTVTSAVAILLFIGFRKDGDKNDAYKVLDRRIRAGDFDPQFAQLGVARPAV